MMQLQSIFLSYLTPPKLPWFGTSLGNYHMKYNCTLRAMAIIYNHPLMVFVLIYTIFTCIWTIFLTYTRPIPKLLWSCLLLCSPLASQEAAVSYESPETQGERERASRRRGGRQPEISYSLSCLLSYEWDLPLVPFCWNRYFLLLFFLSPWLGSQPPHSPGPPGDSPCCHLRTSSFKGKMFIPSCFCSIKTNLLANLKVIATPNFVQNLYYLKEVKTHWSFLLQVFNVLSAQG